MDPEPVPAPASPVHSGLPLVIPDEVEQELQEDIDNIVPTHGYDMTPTVGLGGSAGSIRALQRFFDTLPANTGMAFVVILHLSPEHESTLAELLGRHTAMPVKQAANGEKIEEDHVYVIPPGKHLTCTDGHLKLTDLPTDKGKRVAVDLFFRTLADTHGPHATAIVFSGADGDGALGIKRIKERGGLTIVQDPDEAEHPSMPRTAIATGMVDWILEATEMPGRLVAYFDRAKRLRLPPEEGPQPAAAPHRAAAMDDGESALRDVLTHLRNRTGRDFSYYKRATIVRRISRRMQVNGVETLPGYFGFLRTHPGEAGALQQDLLISVTNFFRDRESFDALEARIPEMFAGRGHGDAVRVWVPACATGEEAYSIAMLLSEHARRMDAPPTLQVFATDLDEEVIAAAREGVYPLVSAADVSEERLRRFFAKDPRGYRARRELREIVLFAVHDLLKDSPFSRLDLVSCRNLFIYLNREAQNRALDVFHFALRPEARLFLGASESIEDGSKLFEITDKKHRIYRARPAGRKLLPVPAGPSTLAKAIAAQEQARERLTTAGRAFGSGAGLPLEVVNALSSAVNPGDSRASTVELHYKLVERFAPPSVVVNAEQEVVHLSESAGRFLQFTGGEPTRNLLRLVHPMLRVDLRAALLRAAQSGQTVEVFRVPLDWEGRPAAVDLRVSPARELAPDFFLVAFGLRETGGPALGDAAGPALVLAPHTEPEPVMQHLERELEAVKGHLRDTVEQYEANVEELKASNEELQAMNEELRSATEELETGREEMQSINEEMTTVNAELKSKLDELGGANSDLQNLMAATAIPTVFVNRELQVMRYTPSAVGLFRFIPSDLGRPISDLRLWLTYPEMAADARGVLRTLASVEREVQASDGRSFLARMNVYRSPEDHIGGVVMTFVDITARQQSEEALRVSRVELEHQLRLFHTTLETIPDYAYRFDLDGRFLYANQRLADLLGRKPAEMIGQNFQDLGYPPELATRLQRQIQEVIETGRLVRDQTEFTGAAGEKGYYEYIFTPLRGVDGRVEAVVGATRDVTERTVAGLALSGSEERMRRTFEVETVGILYFRRDGTLTGANPAFLRLSGFQGKDLIGGRVRCEDLTAPEFREVSAAAFAAVFRDGRSLPYEKEMLRADGSRWWALVSSARLNDDEGVKFVIDLSARKAAESALAVSEERFRQFAENSSDVLWIINAGTRCLEYVSPAVDAIWGEPPERILGNPGRWTELLHPEDVQRATATLPRLLAGETLTVEYRIVCPRTGQIRWVRDTGFPIRDAAGAVVRAAGIAQDITEEKNAADALARSETTLRLVLENARDYAIFSICLDRRILSWNAGAQHILGYTPEEVLGRSADIIFTPEDLAAHAPTQEVETARRDGRAPDERLHIRKDRSRFWASGVLTAMRDAAGVVIGFVKIFRDQTDARATQEAMERSREQLMTLLEENRQARADAEAASKAKDQFFAVLSHELRTPLTPVLMAAKTLSRRRDLPAPVMEGLAMIARNVQLEAGFIDDLLDLTRIGRGKLDIVRAPVDLREAIRRAVEVSQPDMEAKAQRFEVSLEAPDHAVTGDLNRLQQVFWNLLKNAAKFTPENGTVRLRTLSGGPGQVLVEVSDTGIGIAAEALGRIFNAFEQADAAITRQFGGLGLGLAISKATVDAHGGTLSAASPGPGQGATLTARLPLATGGSGIH